MAYNYWNHFILTFVYNSYWFPGVSKLPGFKSSSLESTTNKFQSMPLRSNAQKDNDLQIEVEDNVITVTSNMKILGIHIDSKLNLNGYIAFLCVKAGRQLNVSECMKWYLDYVSRMAIYNSFIISTSIIAILSGCSSVSHQWTNIQKRLLRFVCNDFVSNYSELLEKCVSGGEALRYMSMVV